jgi:hypothetical protein
MSKYFITFGGGTKDVYGPPVEWAAVAKRLALEATNTRLFDKSTAYIDEDLKRDKNFWDNHSEFIEKNEKGYGYWLWKPYLIRKTMQGMKDGGVLVYADTGCEIGTGRIPTTRPPNCVAARMPIKKCMEAVGQEKIIASCLGANFLEFYATKMDLPIHLGIVDEPYMKEPQRQATVIMFCVCAKTRGFVNDWYSLCCNYHLLDDSPSISKNHEKFATHRHDQSIFSQLTKKHNLFSDIHLFEGDPRPAEQYIQITRCRKTS